MALDKPVFFETDANKIVAEMVSFYETETGRSLQPGQAERLLINAFAYREQLIRIAANDAVLQNLLAFSRAPALDYLGELLGVVRLAATSAETTLSFSFAPGHTGATVPAGTRVAPKSGQTIFLTKIDLNVAAGVETATVGAFCEAAGEIGNGFLSGDVSVLLDPLAAVSGVVSLTETAGGTNEESDDALRERIRLAPGRFSNAGSVGAYVYHAKTAHPSIIDVAVVLLQAGTVGVFPLVEGGAVTPVEILDAVEQALNDEKVRPLTDTVIVSAPTRVEYELEVDLTLYTGAEQAATVAAAEAALQAFADERTATLGRDIVVKQAIRAALVSGVYDLEITSLPADVVIPETSFAFCTNIQINVIGYNNG